VPGPDQGRTASRPDVSGRAGLLLGISGTATKVAVEVMDFKGNPGCKLVLHDATDGSQLDFGTGPKGGPRLLLDPNGRTQVYLSNLYCGVRVSSA
jgi:hypothetical protein